MAWAASALAQVPVPSPADPSRIEERLPPPPSRRAPELPRIPGAPSEVPEALKAVRVELRQVRIEGAKAIPEARLQQAAARYVGRVITGAEIFELARELTALYRSEGYLLSFVVVPPQSLADGRLVLRAVEGYIDNVVVQGDPALKATLARIGEKIRASRPLEASVLERYLLIANDLAGVQLRSILAPSATPGAADLTFVATEKKLEGFAALDNYGSKFLGPGQLTVGAAANRLAGNDQLRFTGLTTGNGELNYAQLGYGIVVNTEGLKLGASVSQARTKPGDALEPFDVRGRADTVSFSAAYPFVRTRNRSVLGRAVFDARNVETDILGARFTEDRIRALRFGVTFLALDRLDGANVLDVELSQGIGGTSETDALKSRAGADGRFHKLAFDYERFQPIGGRFGLTLGLGGQWTNEPLLSSEEFALGGRRFGRAYEPAEVVGDRALAFRVEPAWFARPFVEGIRSWQLYAFYDGGKVWNETSSPSQSLASAGFGTRLALGPRMSVSLELADPLTKPIASTQASGGGKRARVLASVAVRF